jgi:acyl-coenzyme A synthetase/AMP-(fatty) acid ligase
VHFVPSMLEGFLQEPELGDLSCLRALVCSGEALGADLARRFQSRLGRYGTELHNLYGPTEAAVDVSWYRWTGEGERGTVPIGSPVANTELYVVDGALRPVPVGVAGELLIGGVQVARGYLGRPGLTAERFLPDPFGHRPGARVYRTGDLVRRLAGGDIEFLGRLDHQVKIRGYRIELGEVDAHVRAVPGVADCLITTHEDEEGHRRLAAYFVPADAGMTSRRLREELRRTLPAHLVPSVVVPVDAWPVTPNGKVDRAALSALRRGRGGTQR